MDPFDKNNNNDSGSESQGDNYMELDDDTGDVRHGAYAGEDIGTKATVVDTNIGSEYLCCQPSTSGNNGRKRRSESSYPFAEKVSRSMWNVENQPLEVGFSFQESELNKTSADVLSVTNVVKEPKSENIRDEPPEKCGDISGILLCNDDQDYSKAIISPGVIDNSSPSSEEFNIQGQVQKHTTSRCSSSSPVVDYSRFLNLSGLEWFSNRCKCGWWFPSENDLKEHRRSCSD